jgi:hypothetical protein
MQGTHLSDRGAAPGFDSSGNDHRGLARCQQTHRHRHRIKPGATLRVNRKRGTTRRQARCQRQHSGRIATRAKGIAEYKSIYRVRRHAGTLQQRVHHWGPDLVRLQCAKCATLRRNSAASPGPD